MSTPKRSPSILPPDIPQQPHVSVLQHQLHRAVVGAHDLRVNLRVLQLLLQALRYAEVVDAPPRILGPGAEAVGPPGVDSLLIRIKIPKSIDKARI